MDAVPELDEATRQQLRWEAERLAAEQGMDLKAARQIVWADYLDELAAHAAPMSAQPVPEMAPPETTELPAKAVPPSTSHPVRGFWQASKEVSFTPEWLAANKARLAQVKRLVGLRSK